MANERFDEILRKDLFGEEVKVPYFAYRVNDLNSDLHCVALGIDQDMNYLLSRIYSGKSLFELNSNITPEIFQNLGVKALSVQSRIGVLIDGKLYFNEAEQYKQVGKLLIPSDQVLSKDNLKEIVNGTRNIEDKLRDSVEVITEAQKAFYSGHDYFFRNSKINGGYTPISEDKHYILKPDQYKLIN